MVGRYTFQVNEGYSSNQHTVQADYFGTDDEFVDFYAVVDGLDRIVLRLRADAVQTVRLEYERTAR